MVYKLFSHYLKTAWLGLYFQQFLHFIYSCCSSVTVWVQEQQWWQLTPTRVAWVCTETVLSRPNLLFIEANDVSLPKNQYDLVFSNYLRSALDREQGCSSEESAPESQTWWSVCIYCTWAPTYNRWADGPYGGSRNDARFSLDVSSWIQPPCYYHWVQSDV